MLIIVEIKLNLKRSMQNNNERDIRIGDLQVDGEESSLFSEPSYHHLLCDDSIVTLPKPDQSLLHGLIKIGPPSTAGEEAHSDDSKPRQQLPLRKGPSLMDILCGDASDSDSSFDRFKPRKTISF